MTYFLKTSAKVLFAALALTSSAKAQEPSQYLSVSCKTEDNSSYEYKLSYYENSKMDWEHKFDKITNNEDFKSLKLKDLSRNVLAFLKQGPGIVCEPGCREDMCEKIYDRIAEIIPSS